MSFVDILVNAESFLNSHSSTLSPDQLYIIQGWCFFGLVALLIMSWQDVFNNKKVDDRRNWFMIGATYILIAVLHANIWIVVLVSFILMLGIFLSNKYLPSVGRADVNCLLWILLGFYLIGVKSLVVFCVVFMGVHFAYVIAAKLMDLDKLPYVPVLFFDFLFTVLLSRFI